MDADAYLEAMLEEDKVRPLPGHLIGLKHTKNKHIDLEGYGQIAVSQQTASGLVVVSNDTREAENYKALLVTIFVLGDEPDKWNTRWFDKKKDWKTTFAEQRIDVGTTVAIRAVSGVDQVKGSKFIQLRYDEVSAIGQAEDATDVPDMLPAPGWVLVQLDTSEHKNKAGLHIYAGLQQVLDQGQMSYGTIIGLPRGYPFDDLHVGDTICFPTHTGAGATEFVEFEEGLRCLPIDDILGVVDA